MSEWKSRIGNVWDGHVHVASTDDEGSLLSIREATGVDKMALVAIQCPETGTGLPEALYMKARHPERFFVFAGLNHAARISPERSLAPQLVEQVELYVKMGCDGVKMIEGKPSFRKNCDIPVTDGYFADYWSCVEELGLPIVWHVNDPEEFWDPLRIPGWAKERDWGYGPNDAQKEQLYGEVDKVLAAHPDLKIIFAHFYFLSADLPRAKRFLDEHPSVRIDLAPGIEMLYNLSRDTAASREFFIEYAERIVFGTDIFSSLAVQQGSIRAGLIFHWLESDDTFRVPEAADFLLGPPEDGLIRGMSLPVEVLENIYRKNLMRLVGPEPRALDVPMAIEECRRLATIAETLSNRPADQTEAARAARTMAADGRIA